MTDVSVASGMTTAGLRAIPNDGHRRELIDGELFVTPTPMLGHQEAAARLFVELRLMADGHRVLFAPVDLQVDATTCVQPDIVVFGPAQAFLLDQDFASPSGLVPEVVVEISSSSTRRIDLIHKPRLYERAGVREYWFVDREARVVDVHTFGDDDDLRSAAGDERIPSRLLEPQLPVGELLAW